MKISIIVPIYNVPEKKLIDCIESLLNQTYKNIEVILVDDGSTTNSGEICDRYKSEKIIKIIHQKNKGLSGARNTGVKNCSGEYYTFVDGDDQLVPNAIESIIDKLKNCDVICTRLIPSSKFEDIGSYPYDFNKIYSSNDELSYLKMKLLDFNGNNNSSCGKFYNLKLTLDWNLYHDEMLKQGAEDLEFNFRFFSKARKIKFLPDRIYKCIYNENSITRSFNINNQYLIIKCFKKIKENIDIDDTNLIKVFNERLQYVIVNTAISGFFNPCNNMKFKTQKKEYITYISDDIFKESFRLKSNIDFKRRVIITFIKYRMFIPIKIIAFLRYKQKNKNK